MVKVYGPMHSMDASGTIGKVATFSKWKGRNYVRARVVPSNPKSGGQLGVRAMMKFLSQYWASFSAEEKADWETRAAVTNISPFNAFVAYNMSRWATKLSPSQADPATEDDDAPTIADGTAVQRPRALLVGCTINVANDYWGFIFYRRLTTGLSCDRNLAVHIMVPGADNPFTWLDYPLLAGTEYFYRAQGFSEAGVLGNELAEWSGTPAA